MRLLLDTHVLIWFSGKKSALSAETRAQIIDPANRKFLSMASIWEMSIKAGLGKLKLPFPIRELVNEFQKAGGFILPIRQEHALAVEGLPQHHKDPFDRMLIAQAMYEDLTIISHDGLLAGYPVSILW